jgi:hypothetical protein
MRLAHVQPTDQREVICRNEAGGRSGDDDEADLLFGSRAGSLVDYA